MFKNLQGLLAIYIWAVTCDFQQCGILTSVDLDEPVQPPFNLKNSKWCSVSRLRLIKSPSAVWSEPLLVAHTKLLEISCGGSFISTCIINTSIHHHLSIQPYVYIYSTKKLKGQNKCISINSSGFSLTPYLYSKWPPSFPNDPLNESFLVFILYKGGQLTPFSKGKGKTLFIFTFSPNIMWKYLFILL